MGDIDRHRMGERHWLGGLSDMPVHFAELRSTGRSGVR